MVIMETYECQHCKKCFRKKFNYDRHMKRKTPCFVVVSVDENDSSSEIDSETIFEIENECEYCHKIFSRSDALSRHIDKYCKIKRKIDNDKEQLFQKLLHDHDKLIKRIEQLEKEVGEHNSESKKSVNQKTGSKIQNCDINTLNNTNNNTTNNTTNNTYNIKLIAFGKEDISTMSEEVYKKIINKGFNSVPALVEEIHFNKNKPENHNVYISNMRDDLAVIYDGENWKMSDRHDLIDGLYDKNSFILVSKFHELHEKLPDDVIRKFSIFSTKYEKPKVKKAIKKDLRLLLYNQREMAEAVRKLSEKH